MLRQALNESYLSLPYIVTLLTDMILFYLFFLFFCFLFLINFAIYVSISVDFRTHVNYASYKC